ncbi:MAG: hypothetical protein U1F58_05040 [Burkholderiales bacterium]
MAKLRVGCPMGRRAALTHIFGRCVVAVFALVVATTAEAAVRYWALQGVKTQAGANVTGTFGYDDVANKVTSWILQIESGNGFLPFTFVPGNSTHWIGIDGVPQFLSMYIYAAPGSAFGEHFLHLSFVGPLDGTSASVALLTFDPVSKGYYSAECGGEFGCRGIASGAVALAPFPPAVGLVDVVEFHHAGFDHYFMTANPTEIAKLDDGTFKGWLRTGYGFKAYAIGSSPGPATNPVCRYYGLPSAGLDSHFYSASAVECYQVYKLFGHAWQHESDNVFQIDLPDTLTGLCPVGTIAIYRVYNNKADVNHRYATSLVVRAQMEAAGWIREGYGPNATIMCAVAP